MWDLLSFVIKHLRERVMDQAAYCLCVVHWSSFCCLSHGYDRTRPFPAGYHDGIDRNFAQDHGV